MRARIQLNPGSLRGLEREVKDRIKTAQGKTEFAMAETFLDCVLANFGATGKFRPWSGWPPLSPAYAKKVGRTYATLEVSGRLKESILIDATGRNFAVTADDSRVPYSTVHQWGGGNNIPQREYFPMFDDGTVYQNVQDLVEDAARRKLQELLS